MEERRKFVRLDTRLQLSYTVLPETQAQQAVTKDISGGGVCLFADDVLTAGQQLQVSLALPGQEGPVNFTAEVVWCEPYEVIGQGARRKGVEAGVRFVEIAPKDQEAIMKHVILNFRPLPARPGASA
jgi:c-di-GMP-binding flagellar brake protein YcgR